MTNPLVRELLIQILHDIHSEMWGCSNMLVVLIHL